MPTQRPLGTKRDVDQAVRERWRAMLLVNRGG
jgi:hypothetical protein